MLLDLGSNDVKNIEAFSFSSKALLIWITKNAESSIYYTLLYFIAEFIYLVFKLS